MVKKKRRVCLVSVQDSDTVNNEVYTSVKKAIEALNIAVNYNTIITKLRRAAKATGERKIEIKNKSGKVYIIEVKELR